VIEALENVDCFEKVFAIRNYGYLLMHKPETRFEGEGYIKKAS
jgi:hypothetical protein